jgi:hypothetical protein
MLDVDLQTERILQLRGTPLLLLGTAFWSGGM